jgi:hypothetical protein
MGSVLPRALCEARPAHDSSRRRRAFPRTGFRGYLSETVKSADSSEAKEAAVRLAEAEGIIRVLRRSADPKRGKQYLLAGYALAAILRAAKYSPTAEERRQARKLWNRACGLSKRGPMRTPQDEAVGEWVRDVIDAEHRGRALSAAVQLEELEPEQKNELNELLDSHRGKAATPRDLPAIGKSIPKRLSKHSCFIVLAYLLKVTAHKGYGYVNPFDPGERIRKIYERSKTAASK